MIISALMTEVILSSETPALARPTWRHVPEEGILYSHRRVKLKSSEDVSKPDNKFW
jgi:hypothetical protein